MVGFELRPEYSNSEVLCFSTVIPLKFFTPSNALFKYNIQSYDQFFFMATANVIRRNVWIKIFLWCAERTKMPGFKKGCFISLKFLGLWYTLFTFQARPQICEKRLLFSPCLSVRPSSQNNSVPAKVFFGGILYFSIFRGFVVKYISL